MSLRFAGDWNPWAGALLAVALAVAAGFYYRRDTRAQRAAVRWTLPLLRALAVFLAVMMLTGPILHFRRIVGERGRVLVFVDASASMKLADPGMEPDRKLLVLHRLGWLPAGALDTRSAEAADALARARRAAAEAQADPAKLGAATRTFAREAEAAADSAGDAAARVREKVGAAARKLAGRADAEAARTLGALAAEAAKLEKEIRDAFSAQAKKAAGSGDAAVRGALAKFDALPRWKRVEAVLLGGPRGLLGGLAARHHVELLALADREAETLWVAPEASVDPATRLPKALPGEPGGSVTDLGAGIRARLGERDEERTAVVLLSDGQHNDGRSPLELAKILGGRRVPVLAVGMGASTPPEDVAVVEVRAPEAVFFKDRLKGEIVLKDDMAPGKPLVVRVESGGKTVWEQRLATGQGRLRAVPFDVAVEGLVEKPRDAGFEVLSLPLELKAVVAPVEGEREPRNNERGFLSRAVKQKRKLLLLEGRPRWEFRYLRNLFERDEQWEVNALTADAAGEGAWPAGTGRGKFPSDREGLFAYDLVVFGEVPRRLFRMEHFEWLRDFVGTRGGGVVFIDGRRGELGPYVETPLKPLLPVDWKGETPGRVERLELTAAGARQGALALAGDAERNSALWRGLPPPHGVAPARVLPGQETLVEAVSGDRRVPVIVSHRYGAGRVLYSAIDETWRWRHEVGDLHHVRFWNQLARWVMEPPFAVRDARLSLQSDKVAYAPGESPELRARLRDREGRPVDGAKAEADLWREGSRVATVKFEPDADAGGMYRGRAGALGEGRYEVRVRVEGVPEEELKARAEFAVRPRDAGELSALHLNEDLLRQVAAASGGEYFREEDAPALAARLEPLSRAQVVESDMVLWQSWGWFLPILLLLTVDWAVRKWAGML
jgi:hypothetical protein